MARRTHSETITITLARKQKSTTESNVSEAIQQPSSVKYEQKSDAGRYIDILYLFLHLISVHISLMMVAV